MSYFDISAVQSATALALERVVQSGEIARVFSNYGGVEYNMFSKSEVINHDAHVIKYLNKMPHTGTVTRDAYSDIGGGDQLSVADAVLRWSTDPAANDFVRVATSITSSMFDWNMQGVSSQGVAVNVLSEMIKSEAQQEQQLWSRVISAPANARVAQVNGTKVNSNTAFLSTGSTYTAGSTTARLPIDNDIITVLQPGTLVDIYNGATLVANALRVSEVANTEDMSIVVEITPKTTAANLDGIADNNDIYLTGEKDAGSKLSLPGWAQSAPTAGESFMTRDRSTTSYRFLMLPSVRGSATTTARIQPIHFDAFASNRAIVSPDNANENLKAYMHDTLAQALSRYYTDRQFSVNTTRDDTGAIKAGYGTVQSIVTTAYGRPIEIVSSPLAARNRAYLIDPSTWCKFHHGWSGLQYLKQGGSPMLLQNGAAPGSHSPFFSMKRMGTFALVCLNPQANGVIHNLSA